MKKSLLACALAALCSLNVTANEEVTAEDLVGRAYGSVNASRFYLDSDREKENTMYPSLDKENGFGFAGGYRFNESFEARLGYTDINVKQTSAATALDILYFVDQKSFYFYGGATYFELQNDKTSAPHIGAGFRHYVNKDAALFVEGKTALNFSNDYVDNVVSVGAMYFFGSSANTESKKPVEAPLAASTVAAKPVADSDNDGVNDDNDLCANTPSNELVDATGCTVFTDEMLKFQLVVNFAHDSSKVTDKYLPEIKRLADFMQTYPQTAVVIAGHTSSVGTDNYNQGLSERRAKAIAEVLSTRYSISASRIETVGYGETRLRVMGDNEAAHAENRRIEAEVSGSEKKAVQR